LKVTEVQVRQNGACHVASREGHLVDVLSVVHVKKLTPGKTKIGAARESN
jgi:hypothetical protein